MAWRQVLDTFDVLDSASADGASVERLLRGGGLSEIVVERVEGNKGSTDFVKVVVPGTRGKSAGGNAPTLGLVGRLGGVGARPERIGFVSDGDGALAAIASALKLAAMRTNGDYLPGDVIVATHICPDAPTRPHEPVTFMDSPADIAEMNRHKVDVQRDAVRCLDTTEGKRVVTKG